MSKDKTLKELYREQYELIPTIDQTTVEILYKSEGIINGVNYNKIKEIKQELTKKKKEIELSSEEKLLQSIFGVDKPYKSTEEEKELENLKRLLNELEEKYEELSRLFEGNTNFEEALKIMRNEIEEKRNELKQKREKKEESLKKEIEKLEDKYEKLSKYYNDFYRKIKTAIRGFYPNDRKFPSNELRNKIVEGNLNIAKYYTTIYFRKSENTHSYDDLFQIACLSLMSAAHYYIPSEIATFKTYASRCIENRLKKEVFNKKEKTKNPKIKNYLEREKLLIDYIEMFLKASNNFDEINETTYYRILYNFRLSIKEYNRKLKLIGENKKLLPSFSLNYNKRKMQKNIEEIFNYIFNGLRKSKLKVLLNDDDRNLISLDMMRENIPEYLHKFIEMKRMLELYLKRMNFVFEYFDISSELQENSDGITPTDEDILNEFNRRIKISNHEKYKLKKSDFYKRKDIVYKKLSSYWAVYLELYNVNPFVSNEEYELGDDISKEKERDLILERRGEIIGFLSDLLYYEELKSDENVVLFFTDETYTEVYDFVKEKKSDKYNGYYKIYTKEEVSKYLESLESKTEEEYLKRILDSRKERVNNIVKAFNEDIIKNNKEIKKLKDKLFEGPKFKRYLTMQDILKIKKDILLLLNDDKDFYKCLKEETRRKKQIALTLEEEVINNMFLSDYYSELDKLSYLEKEVLLRYYDINGTHSMTAKEIGEELNISSNKVYKLKRQALNRLSNNEILRGYYEE